MDYAIVAFLNGWALSSAPASAAAIFLASYLIWAEAAAVAAFWLSGRRQRTWAALSASLSAALAWLFNQAVGLAYFRPRPFADHAGIRELIARSPLEKSFPSDHAAMAFALATAVCLADRRWGVWLIAAAALVAAGRVLVGVHYPSDVLSGAAVGAACAAAVHFLIHRLLGTRHRQPL